LAHFLEELQEMIDNQEPVQDIIDKIEKADRRRNTLVFVFLLSFILESLLRRILENDDFLGNNIELYYNKYGNRSLDKNSLDKISKIRNRIDQKSLYNIKAIRNSVAHDGQIYNPKEHREFIETSLGFIYLIANDREMDLKEFSLPKKGERVERDSRGLKIKKRYLFGSLFTIFSIIIFSIFQLSMPTTTIFGGMNRGTYDTFSKNISTYIIKGAEVKNTQGSIENIKSLNKDPKDERLFAFVQRDVLEHLLEEAIQEDSTERDILKRIRVLFPIITGEIHILVKKNSTISSFSDLEDKIISFGSRKSGTSLTAKRVYRRLFHNKDIRTKPYKDFNKAVQNLKDEKIDAIILAGGQPLNILSDIDGVKLVPYLRDEVIDGYSQCWIKKDSYKRFNNKEVRTLCIESFLITNIKDDDDAYLKSVINSFGLYEKRLNSLKSKDIHPKWRDFSLSQCLPKLPFRLEYHSLTKWDTDREICPIK